MFAKIQSSQTQYEIYPLLLSFCISVLNYNFGFYCPPNALDNVYNNTITDLMSASRLPLSNVCYVNIKGVNDLHLWSLNILEIIG